LTDHDSLSWVVTQEGGTHDTRETTNRHSFPRRDDDDAHRDATRRDARVERGERREERDAHRDDMASPSAVVGRLRRVVENAKDETASAGVFDIARDAPFVIGRQQGVDVRFVEPAVSRRHAVFQMVDDRMVLKNMSKLNPVSLNESILDVETAVALRHGDRVGIQLTSEEEATFVFEQILDAVVRSPLRENGGNTPPSASPLKSPKSTPSRDDAENMAPTPSRTPERRGAMTPKSPAKSALKAPENRLAVRPSTARRRSISFAGEEALEAIKWIAPHDGKVELCGRIAPLALDAPRSPRRRRSTSKSPKSAVKMLPAPEVPLMLPAPETKASSETKRRSSISFKAVEDGEENDTPDSRFTRGGARMKRNDTPRASSKRKSTALRSPSEFSPIGTLDGSEGETLAEKTESVEAMTPPNDSNNLIARLKFVATPSSEMKRPRAPHNTPVAADFNLDGYDVFRTTPSAMPEGLRELFADDGASHLIMRAVETLEAEAKRDVDAAKELDGVLAGLPTPPSAKKRVREWLEAENDFDALPEEEDVEGADAQTSDEYRASPAKSIIVKCRKTKKRRRCEGGKALSARMEQLHRALSATRRALLKERKKNATLQEMYAELANAPREEPPTPAEMKTPKIHMHINVKEATPKTPKVAMHVNVREAPPKTPKVTLNVNVKEATPKLVVETEEKEKEEEEDENVVHVRVAQPSSDCCSVCAVVDKCKTVRCDDCSIIFHLKCLKPRLTRTPKGPWTCAECAKGEPEPAPKEVTATTAATTTRPTRSTRSSRRM